VPSVIGLKKGEAITALSEAGFRASVEIADSIAPKGQVFSQTPAGGSTTALGTIVHLQVSTGVPAMVTMPRVVDMRGYDAKLRLERLGLIVDLVRVETHDPDLVGYVIAQDPKSKTELVEGATVQIFVGKEQKGNGNGNGGGGG
jgi:beta-lactam-binding protein with PASTA domain